MPYVKLDCGILNSTLWFERDARELFITALLMAEPFEVTEPTPQIEVNSLELTGWVVPPGWYGFVPAAGVGIINRAGMDAERGRVALELLGSPEASSRSPEFEGRRLVRVNGGYLVLNFLRYRDKDATAAERSRRWREREKRRKAAEAIRATRVGVIDTRDTTPVQNQSQIQNQTQTVHTTPVGARSEHRSHALCGRACLPAFLFREFIQLRGGPEDAARAEVEAWAFALIKAIAEDGPRATESIGDPLKWWRARWEEAHPTRKADEPAAPTKAEDDAAFKAEGERRERIKAFREGRR